MYYYGLVTAAVIMFGFQFLLNGQYEKESGTALTSVLKFTLGSFATGFVVLMIINKFSFEFTPFTLIMALLDAVNFLLYNFFAIKALSKINLSLFSIFAMLGGMALPFAAGLIFYDEKMTLGKGICFAAITVALFLTMQKGESKKGYIYYIGVFVTNGLAGVIPKVFSSAKNYDKTSEAGFQILVALIMVILSGILLIFIRGDKSFPKKKSLLCMAGYGTLSNVANYLSLLGLAGLPATAQFPFITGGVMIVSTILCFFTPDKPKKKEIASVVISFAGLMCLVLMQ